ncbi:CCRK [Acanthosepion pharaonis]|uniref:Cyclin-dependent kinase 20 n=1 Tax=Acanthosepion pharaonis TaxID=158019 RepID=A0A812BCL1_ACAPH|nr:CCRK [Sepia pharaonis]
MEQYTILGNIGEGAHGIVFKAKFKQSGETVALKKVRLKKPEDGIPSTALREIKALQQIEDNPYDLKPANLLISSSGHLKIADFGLARVYQNVGDRQYSHQVATRWYRAPELLYGAKKYDEGVDIWAVGCIFGELLNNSPLFPGENDIEQLCCVLHALGTPTEKLWPGMTELPDYKKITFPENPPIPFEELVPDASFQALDLLEKFLVYSSKERIAANEALLHVYFFSMPLPSHHSDLPVPKRSRQTRRRQQAYDYNPDIPLEKSLFLPEALTPHVT